jgi:hypothetical protein
MSEEDPDERPFCKNVPAQDLLKSERFAKYEDDEADSYLARFSIVRKEKRWVDRLHDSARLKQVTIEYIARKR